jgi:hypothetical protein
MKSSTRGKREKTMQESAPFSFSPGNARYAKKDELVAANVTFSIVAVEFDVGGGFTGQDRWKVSILRDDSGATEIVTLDANEKRDAQLQAAKDHIAANGPIDGVRLVKRGNTFYFRPAESRGK